MGIDKLLKLLYNVAYPTIYFILVTFRYGNEQGCRHKVFRQQNKYAGAKVASANDDGVSAANGGVIGRLGRAKRARCELLPLR